MEITRSNFDKLLPLVKKTIKNADFIAIDGEFTGLNRPTQEKSHDLDTPQERYTKARNAVQEFGLIQFGLSTFRYDIEKKKYTSATFCFYLLGRSREICCYDPSSMNFLAEHGFDFNKLFKDGLPYMSLADEASYLTEKENTPIDIIPPSPVKVNDEVAKKFLKEALAKVTKYLSDNDEEILIFPGDVLSGFHRKILYNNVASKFQNILVHSLGGNNRNIEVRKFDDSAAKEKFLKQKDEDKFREKVGFTEVFRYVLEQDKPIIGHNTILDFLHSFHKLIQPLPESLGDFKSSFRANFPDIYDTKLLAKDPPFCGNIPNTALGSLYSGLLDNYKPPVFEIEEDCESYKLDDKTNAHDAGYDAFITGVCFITMVKTLDGNKWNKQSVVKSRHLDLYRNKINMMNSYDIPYLSISGPDVELDRRHIYEVTCPKDWSQMNVRCLFSKLKNFKITWVSSTKLYVIPMEDDDVLNAAGYLSAIQASCPLLASVKMYNTAALRSNKRNNDATANNDFAGFPEKIQEKKKRKSEPTDESVDGGSSSNPRDLKRLKSVGSNELSLLTLESPKREDNPLTPTLDDTKLNGSKKTEFQEPDW